MRYTWLLLISLLILGLMTSCSPIAPDASTAFGASAQGDILGLIDALKLLAQGVGVGAVISFLFERFKWFHSLTSNQRWWMIFGLSLGLPMLATLALQVIPLETWAMLEPYWRALAAGFVGWAGSQVAHRVVRRD